MKNETNTDKHITKYRKKYINEDRKKQRAK